MRTVVTREAEWDDMERAKMEALVLYESKVCACGVHESIAQNDPAIDIKLPVCPVCAGLALNLRVLHAKDASALGDNPAPDRPRPADGRSIRLKFASADQRQESSTE